MELIVSNWAFKKQMTEADLVVAFVELRAVQMTRPRSLKILKESIDKRKRIRFVYSVEVEVADSIDVNALQKGNKSLQIRVKEFEQVKPVDSKKELAGKKVVVVGAGPAGMFAAYILGLSKARVVLLERGDAVEERLKKVRNFFNEGKHDPQSNICFGEGGAGTFSDGKLTTRKNHPWIRWILERFVECGAPPEILISGKPHIGSDRLRAVTVNFRKQLLNMGVEVLFRNQVSDFKIVNEKVQWIKTESGITIENPDAVVWATGHSARDSFELLKQKNVPMTPKAFAVGMRIEHPQEMVNAWQHKNTCGDLGAADYAIRYNLNQDRSVYSFCMCPGGQVVCSSSHSGYHVVNGMSNYARNARFANAGIVVKVSNRDFQNDDALAGMHFQAEIEKKSFEMASRSYVAPAQLVKDFLANRGSHMCLESSFKPGLVPGDLRQLFSKELVQCLQESLVNFEKRFPGFAGSNAQLIGTETRTSSPVQIPRGKFGHCEQIQNFFPCGEGAGYAGGIVSAALDGLFIANCIKEKWN